jgi:FixJ family two-component response regulator
MEQRSSTVIVVEDHPGLRRALTRTLQMAGMNVVAFEIAEGLLKELEFAKRVDCLLCDLSLPGMSGLELYGRLIADGVRIPVVFMSSEAIPEGSVPPEFGAICYVAKPFLRTGLLAAIEEAISLRARSFEDNRQEQQAR